MIVYVYVNIFFITAMEDDFYEHINYWDLVAKLDASSLYECPVIPESAYSELRLIMEYLQSNEAR